jgi:hypothetical protein
MTVRLRVLRVELVGGVDVDWLTLIRVLPNESLRVDEDVLRLSLLMLHEEGSVVLLREVGLRDRLSVSMVERWSLRLLRELRKLRELRLKLLSVETVLRLLLRRKEAVGSVLLLLLLKLRMRRTSLLRSAQSHLVEVLLAQPTPALDHRRTGDRVVDERLLLLRRRVERSRRPDVPTAERARAVTPAHSRRERRPLTLPRRDTRSSGRRLRRVRRRNEGLLELSPENERPIGRVEEVRFTERRSAVLPSVSRFAVG